MAFYRGKFINNNKIYISANFIATLLNFHYATFSKKKKKKKNHSVFEFHKTVLEIYGRTCKVIFSIETVNNKQGVSLIIIIKIETGKTC